MRKARQFVQRKNNIKCKATGQEEKTTENTVEVTDLQTKKVEGKVSKFWGTVLKKQVKDESRETQSKGGKHRTEVSREGQARRKAHIKTEINRHFCQMFCLPELRRNNGMAPFTELAGSFILGYTLSEFQLPWPVRNV